MRNLTIIILSFTLSSCHSQKTFTTTQNKIMTDFSVINSDTEIIGSVLIYDLNNNSYYSNDFKWANSGQLPASTFKITNSLIALELGIVEDKNTVFKWNGEQRMFDIWEQDLTFKQAFHYSCVPCYQKIARKIKSKQMNKFIEKFNYGTMEIHADNIDNFWLIGHSKISQFEQIKFLKKLYHSQLPISTRTEQIFKKMFIVKQTDNYILRAKTGLSVNQDKYNGWYVGYIESNNNVYFFATNISPANKYDNKFNNKRKSYTIKVLEQLGFY